MWNEKDNCQLLYEKVRPVDPYISLALGPQAPVQFLVWIARPMAFSAASRMVSVTVGWE